MTNDRLLRLLEAVLEARPLTDLELEAILDICAGPALEGDDAAYESLACLGIHDLAQETLKLRRWKAHAEDHLADVLKNLETVLNAATLLVPGEHHDPNPRNPRTT